MIVIFCKKFFARSVTIATATPQELYGITENTYSTLESRIEAWDVVEEEREAARPVIAQSAPVAKPPNTSRYGSGPCC